MKICPILLVVGCKKCPAFSFCPLTTILGDQVSGIEDSYQKYAEEELKKNKKEESENE